MNMSMERSLQITTTGGDSVVGGGGGLLEKKRGRPIKYDSDGYLRLLSISPPLLGFSCSPLFPSFFEFSSSKRDRGRPLGSGNCQLLEMNRFIEAYVEIIQQPYVWGGVPELLMASHVLK
ncbi:hypothetical protein CsSME_00050327 [Camellia sinensis var. sinensis]